METAALQHNKVIWCTRLCSSVCVEVCSLMMMIQKGRFICGVLFLLGEKWASSGPSVQIFALFSSAFEFILKKSQPHSKCTTLTTAEGRKCPQSPLEGCCLGRFASWESPSLLSFQSHLLMKHGKIQTPQLWGGPVSLPTTGTQTCHPVANHRRGPLCWD